MSTRHICKASELPQADLLTLNSPPQKCSLCYISVQESTLWLYNLVRTLVLCGLLGIFGNRWVSVLLLLSYYANREERPLSLGLKQNLQKYDER